MTRFTKSLLLLLAGALLMLAGCVPGGAPTTSAGVAAPESSCEGLVESQRKLAVDIDELESGKTAPGTWKAALFTLAALNTPAYNQPVLHDATLKERDKVLVEWRA